MPVQLLIVQPTPFCNINCDYCYLPARDSTARLSPEIFRTLLGQVFEDGLVCDPLSLVWHAGEPLAVPAGYYQKLFAEIDRLGIARSRIRHSMQTNATLVSDRWCDFFRTNDVHIGVSLDGPAFLHDRHRRDRGGQGTHERVLKGIEILRANEIEFHVIAVITADSLDYADEVFGFFLNLGVKRLGFNIEELEGVHEKSSLSTGGTEARLKAFWGRLYELQQKSGDAIHIREFERAYETIVYGPKELSVDDALERSSLVAPLGIISMDWQGNLSSFSPELLGLKSIQYGDFVFGNIHRDRFAGLGNGDKFSRVAGDIRRGVEQCKDGCQYFSLCGGGAPSNKYFENGKFDSAETMYCRSSIQMPLEVVLAGLENRLGLVSWH